MLILSLVGVCSPYSLEILTGRGGRAVLHNGRQTLEKGAGGGGRRGEGRGKMKVISCRSSGDHLLVL